MIRPGCTTAAQYSGLPLPLPILTSAGLRSDYFIREYPDPNITFSFHVTGHCLTGSFLSAGLLTKQAQSF
jgi:hypothetical protein